MTVWSGARFARAYPAWGITARVRFSETFLETVGFLVGDRLQGIGPIGTFFVIQEERDGWDGEEDRGTIRWMVTARHVVEDGHKNGGQITARMRPAGSDSQQPIEFDADDWIFDPDDSLDLAIRPMDYEPVKTFKALPVVYAQPSLPPTGFLGEELGHPTYFAGLLDWPGPIATEARPVLRSGTVAALRQSGITWHTESGNRRWTAPQVHLIDVRSFGGFSGSPCWIQWYLTYVDPVGEDALPEEWARRIRAARGDPSRIGQVATMTNWWGVFVAHQDQPGVGIVIPASRVVEMLDLSEVRELKKRAEDRLDEAERLRGPKGQSTEETDPPSRDFARTALDVVREAEARHEARHPEEAE